MTQAFAVGDMVEVTVVCKTGVQYAENVMHYQVDSLGIGVVTDLEGATYMSSQLAVPYKDILCTVDRFEGVKCQIIQPVRFDAQSYIGDADTGNVASDPLSPQTAGILSFRSGLASRSRRGRMYLPRATEDVNTAAGIPSGAYLTSMQTVANAWLGALVWTTPGGNTVNMKPVILSRKLGSAVPITSVLRRPYWGTMRKRSFAARPDIPPI